MTPAIIAHAVSDAFKCKPELLWLKRRGKQAPARIILVYMLVQFLPRPEFYRAKAGGTRKATDSDGNIKAVGRLLGIHPSGVRYLLRRAEDMRDDPEFDATLTAIEEQLARSGDTQ